MATAASSSTQTVKAASITTTIMVKAAPGVRVPMEGSPRKYITEDAAVAVTRTAYYIRRLKDGDLVLADAQASPAAATQTTATAAKAAASPATTASTPNRGVGSEA